MKIFRPTWWSVAFTLILMPLARLGYDAIAVSMFWDVARIPTGCVTNPSYGFPFAFLTIHYTSCFGPEKELGGFSFVALIADVAIWYFVACLAIFAFKRLFPNWAVPSLSQDSR